VRSLVHRSLEPEEFFLFLGWNAAVPPEVRRALLNRPAPRAPLPRVTVPVWLLHGLDDRLVLPPSDERVQELCPRAIGTYYPGAGHAPFWDQPDRFNAEIAAFARSLQVGHGTAARRSCFALAGGNTPEKVATCAVRKAG